MHRFLLDQGESLAAGPIRIEGEQARHAVRVKRLREGEASQVLDGSGGVAPASVSSMDPRGRWIELEVGAPERVEPRSPVLEVCCPPPKGDRLGQLIDTLSQVGVTSWRPLRCDRGAEPPPSNKIERLERIAGEAAKQCGRAWVMRIEPAIDFETASLQDHRSCVIVSDVSGSTPSVSGREPCRLLVGPEGGWTPQELDAARDQGVRIARFGAHTMRIETAALAASVILLASATPAP